MALYATAPPTLPAALPLPLPQQHNTSPVLAVGVVWPLAARPSYVRHRVPALAALRAALFLLSLTWKADVWNFMAQSPEATGHLSWLRNAANVFVGGQPCSARPALQPPCARRPSSASPTQPANQPTALPAMLPGAPQAPTQRCSCSRLWGGGCPCASTCPCRPSTCASSA